MDAFLSLAHFSDDPAQAQAVQGQARQAPAPDANAAAEQCDERWDDDWEWDPYDDCYRARAWVAGTDRPRSPERKPDAVPKLVGSNTASSSSSAPARPTPPWRSADVMDPAPTVSAADASHQHQAAAATAGPDQHQQAAAATAGGGRVAQAKQTVQKSNADRGGKNKEWYKIYHAALRSGLSKPESAKRANQAV